MWVPAPLSRMPPTFPFPSCMLYLSHARVDVPRLLPGPGGDWTSALGWARQDLWCPLLPPCSRDC